MERDLNVKTKEPAWKRALMEAPVLSAAADEKGYLPSYIDGIFPGGREAMMSGGRFYEMFKDGKGDELEKKAYAVHSSSILAYNFFHWVCKEHPLRFADGKTYDKVYFEVKMPVLKSSPNAPANVDVVLVSDDCHSMLCFESKLSEYTESKKADFSGSYKVHKNYYNNHFEDDFINFISNHKDSDRAYNYGIAQIVKNLIAITNLHQSNDAMAEMLAKNTFIESEAARKMLEAPLNVKFATVLYLLRDDSGLVPISKAMNYIKLLADFRSTACFDNMIWQHFVLPNYAYNYSDMLAIMRSQMPEGLAGYLEARYPDLLAWDGGICPVRRC